MDSSFPAPTMRQAYLEQVGLLRLREVPVPDPGPGQVLIRMDVSLTCGTDVKTYRRGHSRLPVPGPLGHEGSGRIAAVGPGVVAFEPGQQMVWLPTAPCGTCDRCRQGLTNHCETLMDEIVLGTHGDYVLLPRRVADQHLFPVPEGIAPATAALVEPLACVVRGWSRLEPLLPPANGQQVRTLVVGAGPIGLMHVMLAAPRGPVACVGARGIRGELARQLGAQWTSEEHLSESMDALAAVGFGEVDVAIDCTGQQEVWEQLPSVVRPGGVALLFGGLAGGARATFDAATLHYDEVTLLGSFHYTTADVNRAIRILMARHEELSALITHQAPLAQVTAVFERLTSHFTGGKVALLPDPVEAERVLGRPREELL